MLGDLHDHPLHPHPHQHQHLGEVAATSAAAGAGAACGGAAAGDADSSADDDSDGSDAGAASRPVVLVECFTIAAGTGRMPVVAPEDVWDTFKLLPVHLRRVSTEVVCGHSTDRSDRSDRSAAAGKRKLNRSNGKAAAAGGGSSSGSSARHLHGPGCHRIVYTHEPSGFKFRSQRALLDFLADAAPSSSWHVPFAECFECGLSVPSNRLHMHKRIEHRESYEAAQHRRLMVEQYRREQQQQRAEQQRLRRTARAHPNPARMLARHILDDPVAQALADNEDMEIQRVMLAEYNL